MQYYPLDKNLTEILSIAAYLVAIMSLPAFAAVPARDLFFEAVGRKQRHKTGWKVFRTFWGVGVVTSVLFAVVVFILTILQKKFGAQEAHIGLCIKMLFPTAMWLTAGFVILVASVMAYAVSFHAYYFAMRVVARKRIDAAAYRDPMFAREGEQKEVVYKVGEECRRSGYYLCIKGAERRVVNVVYVPEGERFEGQKDEWFVFDRVGTQEE